MVINTDDSKEKVFKRYLYHYLSAYNFNSIISGSGQPQIVRSPLEKLRIALPTMQQQKSIAKTLDKFQEKIDAHAYALKLYLWQKEYLLQQMFI